MNEKTIIFVAGIALAGTSLYWRRRERTTVKSLTASKDWEANATGETDRAVGRAAQEAADHLDGRVEDLPDRVRAVDEERRDLRRELDTVRERWADALWHARSDIDDGERGDPPVFVAEFEHGELPDARAFAKRALEDEAITLVAAHGDNSFAVAVGEELSEAFSAEDVANELADEVGGGAGGTDRLAAGGGATGALADGCRRVRDRLFQSGAVHAT